MPQHTFETGAVFAIVDRFSEPLAKLAAGIEGADEQMTILAKSAGLFASNFGKAATKAGEAMKGLTSDVEAQSKLMSAAMDGAFSGWGAKAGLASDKVLAEMSEMEKGVLLRFEGIKAGSSELFNGMDAGAVKGADAAVVAFGRIDASIKASMAGVAALSAEMAKLGGGVSGAGASVASMLHGGSGGASTAHRRGGDGVHFGRVGGDLGGVHASISGNVGLAAAGIALDGVYEAALIDDAVAKALNASEIPIGKDVTKSAAGSRIHDMIQHMSGMTGYSFHDTGESILEGQRLLSGMQFGPRNDLLEKIIPFAATEALQKGSTLPEATEAIIGIAHQTQTYDAPGIEKIAKSLAFTSMLTPSGLPQFQTALGYSLPQLYNGLNMDPSTIMLLTATMQQSGIKGTKSGTWLRSFFEQSEPGSDEHNEALKKLGMLDASNKPTWRKTGADGKVDWEASMGKLSGILQHDAESIPIDDRLNLLRKAYGERGTGFASLMMGKRFTENLSAAEEQMHGFKGGEEFLNKYADASILQQGKIALQQFNVAMSDLGTHLMPGATKAIHDFSDIVKAFDSDHPLQGLGKLFWDNAIKPDLGPLGRLNTSPPSDADRSPPVDMTDPRRRNPLKHDTAFFTGGLWTGDGNEGPLTMAVAGGFLLAFKQIQSGALGSGLMQGMGGGGSGFINASYEADDGTIARYARGGGGPGAGHFFSAADREANIRYWAAKNGISPDVAMAVSRSEGFKTFTGDYGSSHGDFQMHEAANIPGQRSGGLGDLYRRATGKNPADPHNELDLDRFALEQAAKSGWGPWHGAARIGIHGRHGMDGHYPVTAPPARRSVSPGSPADHGEIAKHIEAAVERGLSRATVVASISRDRHTAKAIGGMAGQHLASSMRFPTATGGADHRGTYISPGTPAMDTA